ncbi:hypothetical protein [Xanthobacter oligotrophicus]|uniref:hypothetical protein n=1 Tax=Xanthobacter oligotrophicus TaxID=2607286 RepID=UPI0011F38760|nr:hypothetical protein [Xanthobacter oligotrophicus]MCG5237416.1 hypothetical protein [Xanthobacter oligotrophicus]
MTVPAPAAHLTEADRTLAAEYVLGTLDSEERKNVRARIAADPPFAGLVRLWERRLSPLHELAVPVTPPPSIWRVIVADLKAAPAAAPPKTLRKVPPPAEPAPRPVVGEVRPGRAPAPRPQGPVATVRRLFGFAPPGRGAGEGPPRPKRPAPVPPPAAPPVPVALRVPGGRTLGGAIQDAVAAGLLPPAPPLPEPPPQAAASERADSLPPPLKLAPPAPPRPRPVPEPLTPPPAFIFLEPDPPPAAEGTETGTDQVLPAPPPADEGALTAGPPPPPPFTFLEPEAPSPDAFSPTAVGANQPAPSTADEGAAPAVHAAEIAAGADQASPGLLQDGVTPALPGSPAIPMPGVFEAEAIASSAFDSVEAAPISGLPVPTSVVAAESHATSAEGGSQVPAELLITVLPYGPEEVASLETVRPPSGTADVAASFGDDGLGVADAVRDATAEAGAGDASSPHAQPAEVAASAEAASPEPRTEPATFEPAPLQSVPAQSTLATAPPIEPTPVEPSAEPPSADPAAGAKGEEAPPLPGWAAVVASGVVSALPEPAAAGDEAAPADGLRRPMRRSSFPWRAATLTLTALLIAVAAFAAYREWFWPRDGQWVGVLQSEPLPSIAVRLDPDSGVIFVRSFAPVPPEGEINRLWLLVPGRPALLLGAFTAGLSGRTPALAGLGRNRLGAAEVVVTQEPKLGSGAASADGQPPGKVVYRGRLAPE